MKMMIRGKTELRNMKIFFEEADVSINKQRMRNINNIDWIHENNTITDI